jgi:protein-S-isoprenylcysteine O-methyltransferase Ste14
MQATDNSVQVEWTMLAWSSVRLAIFVVATVLLAAVSRRSLLSIHSHGFYRFFVFEAILALILTNLPFWIRDAFSWYQVVSWILLLTSVFPLALGIRALHGPGRSGTASRQEPELLAFERTTRLVRAGVFRHIRHPMYSSLLFLAWGVFFKLPSVSGATLAVLATEGLSFMAKIEEAENSRAFGQEYREYMVHTKRFIPHVF